MNPAVQMRKFSYVYPDGTPALWDIDLSVEYGQKVALVGPNGGGKTTLLLAMAGFIRGRGEIIIDGLDLCSRNLRQIRSMLGCCLENPDDQLFMPTLYEDIAFGPLNLNMDPQQVRTNIDFALQQVGLTALAEKAPHYLSAGQKRAAAIATVLSMSPKIITFDEPDGSLDPRSRKNIERLLRSLPQTLIVATCNIRFAAAVADRAMVVDNGRIVADGPAADILYNAELMTAHGLETP
jgi:cobalt/nickel transport system ATP-binding protein